MQVSNSPVIKGQNIGAGIPKQQNAHNAVKGRKDSKDFIIKGEVKARQRKATEIVIKAEKSPGNKDGKASALKPVIKGEIRADAEKDKKADEKGTLEKFMEKHPSRFEAVKGKKGKMVHKPY